ncbi:MAG: lipopolysaccharide biosynthesis protein [Bosea sp. (in: a-proteobacteria)]
MLTASEQQGGIADAGEAGLALESRAAPIRTTASTRWQRDPQAAQAAVPDGAATRVAPAAFDQGANRFFVNVTSSIAYVVLNTVLMIWYVPFLIGHLGLAAYGMVALVNALLMILAVVTDSLTGGTFRYLAIDLNRGDAPAAMRTFNTALALAVIGCGVILLPIAATAYYLPTLFRIPLELVAETRFLLLSTSLLAFTALLGGTFGASSLIAHRFDLRNIVRALTTLGRVGIVALCFMIWPASLWHVGAGMIAAALLGLAGDMILWKRLTPQLGIQPRLIDSSQFRPLIGISGWTAVNTVGALLLMQVDLLVVNAFFGSEMTGRYGSIILLPTLIYTLMEAVIPILSPAIMASYATGDIAGLRRTALQSVRLLALILALPVGLLCGLGRPLLSLWLGPSFADLDIILIFLVCHLTVTLATRPLSYVLTAHNKVKLQGLVTLALGVANIALVVALARYSSFGAAGVAAAGALAWTVRNGVFISTYSATLMGLRWHAFYGPLALGVGVAVAIAMAGQVSARLWWPSDWFSLATTAAAISLAYCGLAYAIGLTAAERALLRGLAKRWTSRSPRHTP